MTPNPLPALPAALRGWLYVIDIETTGLVHEPWAEPIELGAVLLDPDGVEQAVFSSLIRPGRPPPIEAAGALAVNGILASDLLSAPNRAAVAHVFEAWRFSLCPARAGDASFNWPFDSHFLGRISSAFAQWEGVCLQATVGDLWRATRGWTPKPRTDGSVPTGPSLKEAAAYYRIEQPTAHRALADARTAAALVRHLRMAP